MCGITHEEAAKFLGYNHRQTYTYIETGKQKILPGQAERLLVFFRESLKVAKTVKRNHLNNTYQLVRQERFAGAESRTPIDFYPTPRSATVALIEYMNLPTDTPIWESASGEGHISKVLEEYGYRVISTDLRETESVYGEGYRNYFDTENPPCSVSITNPPYYYAKKWIRHSHAIGLQSFSLLLKSNFFHTSNGEKLYAELPPSLVLPVSWTLNFKTQKGKETQMDFTWFVWEKNSKGTKYHVLRKPKEAKA